jgi:hypothetical protein
MTRARAGDYNPDVETDRTHKCTQLFNKQKHIVSRPPTSLRDSLGRGSKKVIPLACQERRGKRFTILLKLAKEDPARRVPTWSPTVVLTPPAEA